MKMSTEVCNCNQHPERHTHRDGQIFTFLSRTREERPLAAGEIAFTAKVAELAAQYITMWSHLDFTPDNDRLEDFAEFILTEVVGRYNNELFVDKADEIDCHILDLEAQDERDK